VISRSRRKTVEVTAHARSVPRRRRETARAPISAAIAIRPSHHQTDFSRSMAL
jgi:hypothetical protein